MQEQTGTPVKTKRERPSFLGVSLALLLVCAAFFSGLQLGSGFKFDTSLEANVFSIFRSSANTNEGRPDLSEFWRVWDLLESKYVTSEETLSAEDRIDGAIMGLVESYNDPYTVFLPPQEASDFEDDIAGNFEGLGMEVGMRDGIITVIAPLPGTPAEKAGILTGDAILEIDEESTENMSIERAVRMIRGPKGTTVSLVLYREGVSELIELDVVRDTIAIPTIETDQQGDVFIISLYNFNAMAEMKMQEALREYVQSGSRKLILDLRGNPGGFLQSAVSIASYFLPTGKVVLRESFGAGKEELYRSQGKTLGGFAPQEMVVLVDEGSASASEILAGALKEHQVATVIGETTFGKGSVQELLSLPRGSALKVTIARWFTPNGTSISEGGLEPDILIERTPQDRLDGNDPQLEAALRYMAGERNF